MKEIEPYRELWKREEQDNKELREIIDEKDKEIEEMKERWEELYKIIDLAVNGINKKENKEKE